MSPPAPLSEAAVALEGRLRAAGLAGLLEEAQPADGLDGLAELAGWERAVRLASGRWVHQDVLDEAIDLVADQPGAASPRTPVVRELRELAPGEEELAAAALLELRPHHGDREAVARATAAQRAEGYRLVASFHPGKAQAAAVGGFRLGTTLAWGRFLYVDDLVCRERFRGAGHASDVLRHLVALARREGCAELHLDSGHGPDRADAHRLYLHSGLRLAAHHFAQAL